MPVLSASDFRRRLKSPFTGAFLLYGEEEYLKRSCVEGCRECIGQGSAAAAFNLQRYSAAADDFQLSRIADALMTPPFFAEHKLLELHDFNYNTAPESQLTALESLLESGDFSDTLLLLCAKAEEFDPGTAKRPSKLLLRLEKLVTAVACDRETPARLAGWVSRHFSAEHVLTRPDQCHALLERCGHSMSVLANEIAKLCAYVRADGRDRLEDSDIALVASAYSETEEFAFSNRILEGDTQGAFALLWEMKAKKERPELILSSISGVFTDMVRISVLTEASLTPREISARLKIHEYKVTLYQRAVRGRSPEVLGEIVRKCSEADRKIKSSSVDSYLVIERLIASLSRNEPARKGY